MAKVRKHTDFLRLAQPLTLASKNGANILTRQRLRDQESRCRFFLIHRGNSVDTVIPACALRKMSRLLGCVWGQAAEPAKSTKQKATVMLPCIVPAKRRKPGCNGRFVEFPASIYSTKPSVRKCRGLFI